MNHQFTKNDFDQMLKSMQTFPIPTVSNVLDLIKKRTPDRITSRAPNSYFIYRKVINDQLKNLEIKLPMTVTSQLTSYSWKNESLEVKRAYKQLSKEFEKDLNTTRNRNLTWNDT